MIQIYLIVFYNVLLLRRDTFMNNPGDGNIKPNEPPIRIVVETPISNNEQNKDIKEER